jgi:hypothetical protein
MKNEALASHTLVEGILSITLCGAEIGYLGKLIKNTRSLKVLKCCVGEGWRS